MKDLFFTRFFPTMEAEGNGGTGGTTSSEPSANSKSTEPTTTQQTTTEPTRVFTQEELNRIAANEKRQGMASALKTLGFEDEKVAQEWVKKYREFEESKKDDLTKAQETLEAEKREKDELAKKADLLEKRFKVVASGVPADKADDVVLLAMAKVTDNKTFEECLEDLKNTYPIFFEAGASAGSVGTGTGGTPPRKSVNSGKDGSIGKRLAEQRKTSTQTKKSYFSN